MRTILIIIFSFHFFGTFAQNDSINLYLRSCEILNIIKGEKDSTLLEVYRNSTGPKYITLDAINSIIAQVEPWLRNSEMPDISAVEFSRTKDIIKKKPSEGRNKDIHVLTMKLNFIFIVESFQKRIEFVYKKVWGEDDTLPDFSLETIHYLEN